MAHCCSCLVWQSKQYFAHRVKKAKLKFKLKVFSTVILPYFIFLFYIIFQNNNSKGAMISVLEINKLNTVLLSGDSNGFIYIWNIDGYCSKEPADKPPECKYPITFDCTGRN